MPLASPKMAFFSALLRASVSPLEARSSASKMTPAAAPK